jgi:hypothetical protein
VEQLVIVHSALHSVKQAELREFFASCHKQLLASGFQTPRTEVLPDNAQNASPSTDVYRWDEKAGLRRDAVRSQVIDVLEAQIKGDRQ